MRIGAAVLAKKYQWLKALASECGGNGCQWSQLYCNNG